MSTMGNITAPASSRLFCKENHVQYFYISGSSGGYNHNWENPAELNRYGGARHAEIMVPQTWSQPFRGGPATPDCDWYAVDELTARMISSYVGVYPFGTFVGSYTFSSPGKTSAIIGASIAPDGRMPICPTNFTGVSPASDCWVMRKGEWDIDASLYVGGSYGGVWTFTVYASAYRDYDLYSAFRGQQIYQTTFSGSRTTFTPITPGSPLHTVLRHNPLWDLTFSLSPDSGFDTTAETIYDFTFHAIRV